MYGPLIVAAAILPPTAGRVLFLHDRSEARSRKAFERIFEEAGGAAERPGFTAAGRTVAASARRRPGANEPPPSEPRRPGSAYRIMTRRPLGANPRAGQMPRRFRRSVTAAPARA